MTTEEFKLLEALKIVLRKNQNLLSFEGHKLLDSLWDKQNKENLNGLT